MVPLLAIIGFIVSVILIYKLVKRRNTHFKRKIFLFEDIVTAVKTIAAKKGVDVRSDCHSVRELSGKQELRKQKKARYFGLSCPQSYSLRNGYVNYFLMKGFYKHEKREDGFWEDLSKTLDKIWTSRFLCREEQRLHLTEASFSI